MILELTPEQQAFREAAESFAVEKVAPLAADIDESGEFPRELVAEAGRRGLMGIRMPAAWGGLGLDTVSYAVALEAIAKASATVAVIVAVNNSLVGEPIARFGTEEQKRKWLEPLASGKALGTFALSEEEAGTDAANQTTLARPDSDGFRLDGRKVWVSTAESADVAIVFAATTPGARGRGISAFLVPLSSPGIECTARNDSLGVRGLGCMDVEFHDVRVERAQLLGEPDTGFRIAMWALDGGRIAIAAQALGVGYAALEEALRHARTRKTFGKPIASYQAIQWMLADMATELSAARVLMLRAADFNDRMERSTLEAAMAKLHASEAAHMAADKAMQILASAGYRRGSRVERLFRDARATQIYQGTSEVQRIVIASRILARG
jgi:butyryl-CoA dehydrogenase